MFPGLQDVTNNVETVVDGEPGNVRRTTNQYVCLGPSAVLLLMIDAGFGAVMKEVEEVASRSSVGGRRSCFVLHVAPHSTGEKKQGGEGRIFRFVG